MLIKLNKILFPVALLFIVSILLLPLAMPLCGTNGFHVGFSESNSFCGHGPNLAHISYLRSLIFAGMIAVFFLFAFRVFKYRIYSLVGFIKKNVSHNLYFLLQQFNLERLKPYDKLLLAYARGLIQPKYFWA